MESSGRTVIGVVPYPKLLRDFPMDAPARLKRAVRTQTVDIPSGSVGTVSAGNAWTKLTFRTERCGRCGVAAFVRGLSRDDLELVLLGEG